MGKRWVLLLALLILLPGKAPADPTVADITVTGNPASPEFLREILARHRVEVPADQHALEAGEVLQAGTTRIRNVAMPPLLPALLAFSDHPEKVADVGVLFWGGLLRWRPVRLQYYHEGAPDAPAHVLSLYLQNPDDAPVQVHLIAGTAGPNANPIEAGHQSGLLFLGHLAAQEGEVVVLGPHESLELFQHVLPPQQTVSGIVQMVLTTPGRVYYHVVSRHSVDEPVSFPTVENPADVHARGAFMVTNVHANRSYDVGGSDAWIAIGNHAPSNVLSGKALAGDYGITYDMSWRLRNATPSIARVQLLFEPRGGSAAGSFLINGRLFDVPLTRARQDRKVATFSVPPGGRLDVRVLTIPEGASSYPVRLVWHTLTASNGASGARNPAPARARAPKGGRLQGLE